MNIKNNDQKCFLWCHVRHINFIKVHPERITRNDRKIANNFDYDGVEFPVREKCFNKIETKNNIYINVFCYENKMTLSIYISDQKCEDSIDLVFVTDENKSHYVYINDFDRFNKNKKYICKSCLQCFSGKNVLKNIKKFV